MHSVLITSYELIYRWDCLDSHSYQILMGTEVFSETLVIFKKMAWLTAQEDFANKTITGFEVLTVLTMKRDITPCSLIEVQCFKRMSVNFYRNMQHHTPDRTLDQTFITVNTYPYSIPCRKVTLSLSLCL
jgi:hypothetical protein